MYPELWLVIKKFELFPSMELSLPKQGKNVQLHETLF